MNNLYELGIKSPVDRWAVRRPKHSIDTHVDRCLTEKPPIEVDAWLAEMGQ